VRVAAFPNLEYADCISKGDAKDCGYASFFQVNTNEHRDRKKHEREHPK
jgi:hypothetical protein